MHDALLGMLPPLIALVLSATPETCVLFASIDSKYTVSFGNPQAKVRIVEYYSLSCKKCLQTILDDFSTIKEKYIDTGEVYWTFHPDPADLPTLHAMCCLEKLLPEEKEIFFLTLVEKTKKSRRSAHLWAQMQMRALGRAVPELSSIAALEMSSAVESAKKYLAQEKIPLETPSVQINGVFQKEFPSLAFIERLVKGERKR